MNMVFRSMSRSQFRPRLAPPAVLDHWRMAALFLSCVVLLSTAFAAGSGTAGQSTVSETRHTPSELLDAGRIDELVRQLAPQAESNNASALNYLGRAYFELRDWDNAVRYCERAAQLQPANATFQLWLGRSYGEKASVASPLTAYALARKTVAAFTYAHTLDRQNLAISHDLAEYYATAPAIVGGGSDKALALAVEMPPADAAWVRAMVASNSGHQDEAEHQYNESIRLDHNSASTYLDFARYLRGKKNWDGFQQNVELAIRSQRIRPADRYDAAELLLVTNRDLPEAERQMRAYLQGRTDESAPVFRAHYLLGEILEKIGDPNRAAAEYQAALDLASSYRQASEALRHLKSNTRAAIPTPYRSSTTEP
jgi:tetratricopeptide (TPR) repeat protein